MFKILIVEDHETLGYVLLEYLKMHGFNSCLETSAEDGLKRIIKECPDLIILDVSLPGMDGFEMAKEIRKTHKDLPFIFLTARGLKVDRLKGLKLEADDYLIKPVDEEELVLRIKSILRRTYPKSVPAKIYRISELVFEPANHLLKSREQSLMLREKETAILQLLCEHKGELVTRNSILRSVWGKTDQFTARAMDVHLTRLRKHLSLDPSIRLQNVHGQGFILIDKNAENGTPQPINEL